MPLLNRVASTVHKWAHRVAPLEIEVHSEGSRDPDTREWIPGESKRHAIQALWFSSISVSLSMGVQFTPSGAHEAHEIEIFVPVDDTGVIYDVDKKPVTVRPQEENRDGTWLWPQGPEGPLYEVVQEIANFAKLGGYRWFRARKRQLT